MAEMKEVRVAIIEDNQDLNSMLIEDVKTGHYAVAGFFSAEEFYASNYAAHIVILDINLPGQNGFELASCLRQRDPFLVILVLTARVGTENRILGYESGVDFYIEKPISSLELLAILNRCSKRMFDFHLAISLLSGHTQLVLGERELSSQSGSVIVKERERAFLLSLAEVEGRYLSYDDCKLALGDSDMKQSALEVFVGRVRKKLLKVSGVARPIQSIRRLGYQLSVEIDIVVVE